MNVNLKKFTARFHENGCMEVRLQTKEMMEEKVSKRSWSTGEMEEVPGYYAEHPTSIYVTKSELPLYLSCMEGNEKFLPWFDDITNLSRPHSAGMVIMKMNEGTYQKWEVNFPFKNYKKLLSAILAHISWPQEGEIILSEEELEEFSRDCAPKVKWNFRDRMNGTWEGFKWTEWVEKDIRKSLEKWYAVYPDLKRMVESLEPWAASYSTFGEEIEVDISFDSFSRDENRPDSYGFYIHAGSNWIVNGGIIAHEDNDGKFHYSTHT